MLSSLYCFYYFILKTEKNVCMIVIQRFLLGKYAFSKVTNACYGHTQQVR